MEDVLKGVWEETVFAWSRQYAKIWFEELRQVTKILCENIGYPGLDSNQSPPEYASRALAP
jgi:hypothetical protein